MSDKEAREQRRKHFESLARMGEEMEKEWAQWATMTPEATEAGKPLLFPEATEEPFRESGAPVSAA